MNRTDPFATLKRFVRPQGKDVEMEICEFCSQILCPEHRHLLEVSKRKIICVCDACALRFQHAVGGRFRLIPRMAVLLSNFQMQEVQWEDMALPINLVFIFARSESEKMVAAYPSPAGVTESLLAVANWQSLIAQNPQLAALMPDVEALLINRVGKAREYFIAPIDLCFELAGLIRKYWRGLSGGDRVWAEIEQFFAKLREQTGPPAPTRQFHQKLYA